MIGSVTAMPAPAPGITLLAASISATGYTPRRTPI